MATKAPSVEDKGALNVKDLSSELKSVADWHQLGIKLGLLPSKLHQIEEEHPGNIERRKVEVVDLWLQSTPGASWGHIVTALREMGDMTTAERIELKYVKGAGADSHQEVLSKAFAFDNRQAIKVKFAQLLTNVCKRMLEIGVNVEEFRLFAVASFSPGDCIPESPTNFAQVFDAITRHGLWDYLHYSPLVLIAQNFGANDAKMKALIQNYEKDLKAYTIVAKIEDYIDSDLDTCTDQSLVESARYDPRYNCPVEWKTDFVDHSLQHLKDVWRIFSWSYLGPHSPPTALIDRVRKGCVSVTWLVPSFLIRQLIKRVKIDVSFFQKYRILKVTVQGEVVYEDEVTKETTEESQLTDQKEAPVSKVMMGHERRAEIGEPREMSKMPTQKRTFGGYDYDFVEPPPSVFQTKCPICHLILREPYLVSCCGNNFCHSCIQQLQAENGPCPMCREYNFDVFPNQGLNRALKQLQVYCAHKKDGCQWKGELGELDQHLNSFHVEIEMTKFAEMKRGNIQWYSPPFYTHQGGYKMCLSVCANDWGEGKDRYVSVYAYLMRGEFDDHLKWPFRGHVVIQLCNQLQDMHHHRDTIDFLKTTDSKVIGRVNTGERAKRGWGPHTLIPHNDLNFNPTNNCQYLKNDCLRFQIVGVKLLSEPGVVPTELTMANFEQLKIDSDDWHSPPFYTHPQGYKMCLRVDANGYGDAKGTHVSVFAVLMRGEFDDHLKWPFRGLVSVAMLNQLKDDNHITQTIPFTDVRQDSKVVVRVMERERAPLGRGYRTFIAHTELNYNPTKNCQYLKDNCLHFRIVKVELK